MASQNDDNILVCPVSAQIVLSLALAGAKGKTLNQLSEALYLPKDPEQIRHLMTPLLKSLDGARHVQLNSANKMFVNKGIDVKKEFNELATKTYGSEVEKVDYGNPTEAVGLINKWVESKTNNRIRDILNTDSVNADTLLVLVNALYFRGKWDAPFEPYETRKLPFYSTPENSTEVDMMGATLDFPYVENKELDAKFLRLPYEGDEVSMVIVLPNKVDGLKALEKRIDEVLKPQKYEETKVFIQMPKFTTESTIEFIPIFQKVT